MNTGLDAKIAERIMGWRLDEYGRPYWMAADGECQFATKDVDWEVWGHWEHWNPSGNSEESWRQFGLVLRRLVELGIAVGFERVMGVDKPLWSTTITTARRSMNTPVPEGTPILVAACRAIIEALGDRENDES